MSESWVRRRLKLAGVVLASQRRKWKCYMILNYLEIDDAALERNAPVKSVLLVGGHGSWWWNARFSTITSARFSRRGGFSAHERPESASTFQLHGSA